MLRRTSECEDPACHPSTANHRLRQSRLVARLLQGRAQVNVPLHQDFHLRRFWAVVSSLMAGTKCDSDEPDGFLRNAPQSPFPKHRFWRLRGAVLFWRVYFWLVGCKGNQREATFLADTFDASPKELAGPSPAPGRTCPR